MKALLSFIGRGEESKVNGTRVESRKLKVERKKEE